MVATIRPLGQPGDLGWVAMAHGAIYCEEFGWDTSFEALVARIVSNYSAHHAPARKEAAWIAEIDGHRVGCVYCVSKDEGVAQLRLPLVDPAGRGEGVGSWLLRECVGFAREAGYASMTLWTNSVLVAAAHLYVATGFVLTSEEARHSFGVDLVGQPYDLDLADPSAD